jgi:hypothetical protein
VALGLAALVSLAFGVRYFLAREFMPYHATVAGRSWSELESGTQTAILGMLKIVGGGLATYGTALLWLLVPLNRGETWALWAAATMSAFTLLPTLYVTLWLRRRAQGAKTPVMPTTIVLALVVAGIAGFSSL